LRRPKIRGFAQFGFQRVADFGARSTVAGARPMSFFGETRGLDADAIDLGRDARIGRRRVGEA